MTNHCGQCSMCCKVLPIAELGKPQMTWCGHFRKGLGCSIYADRPTACKDFRCVWLHGVLCGDVSPDDNALRPDKCKVLARSSVQDGRQVFNLWVDPAYPRAHEAIPVRKMIERAYAADCIVVVHAPNETITYDRRL